MRSSHSRSLFGFCFAILLLLTVDTSAQKPSERPPSPVTAAPVLYGYVQSTQTFVGTVVPTKTAIVGSAVDGRVIELRVNEGDRVSAQVFPKKETKAQNDLEVPKCCEVPQDEKSDGEETEEFDPGSIIAKVLTATIELEIEAAQKECVALHNEYLKLYEGTREEEVEQAEALMKAANAAADFEKEEFERMERLYKERKAITSQEYEEAKYKKALAVNNAIERTKAWELADKGPRQEDIAVALARRDMQAKVVEKLQDQMKKYTIRSKFDGYIVKEFTEAGAWVNRGDPIAEVAALDEVDVLVNVLESAISYVVRGEDVAVDIPSLGDEPPREGTVELIVPQADYKTRTFPVKIRVPNEIENGVPVIKAGMLAKVDLPTSKRTLSYVIPKDALTLGGKNPIIYVIDGATRNNQTGNPRPIPVKTSIAVGNFIAVSPLDPETRLQANSLVVTQGNERMQGVAAVKVTSLDTKKPETGFREAEESASSPKTASKKK